MGLGLGLGLGSGLGSGLGADVDNTLRPMALAALMARLRFSVM